MTGAGGFTGRVAVVIPACSGKDDIRSITARLRSAIPFADLLIVEHNSPDGTGRIAGELAAADRWRGKAAMRRSVGFDKGRRPVRLSADRAGFRLPA
jgi:hypothetical protein